MEALPRRGDGFTQKDFALRNASWLISDIITDKHADKGRREGFQAPISNDTGLVIPMAIQAGLGEYARNQLVITPEFGPRLRFSKIFTDMPLESDKPRRPGVAKFCDICTKCVDACPDKALPSGPPKTGGGLSSIKGVRKWTSNAEKCFSFWATLSTDCAICMRVCPFNRDFST